MTTPPTQEANERGASLVEYALLLALIAVVCVMSLFFIGTEASQSLDSGTSSMFVSPGG